MSSGPLLSCLPQLRRAALIHDGGGLTDGQLLGEFIHSRDQAAFECLVKRHAPMVLGVCRRLVRDSHIAEDAFQAVFLVLARRAVVVRPREQVGNWLFGVAYRTALRARSDLARRRSKEKQVLAMPHSEVLPPETWHDVQAVLDEELARLPDKLRTAIVLCDLEGRVQREVARQLRLPPTTLANRVLAARKLLAERLGQRGIALSVGALATMLTAGAAQAGVDPHLISMAAKNAFALSGELGTSAAVATQVVQLSEGVMRMMALSKWRTATCCALAMLFLAVGGLQLTEAAAEPASGKAPAAATSAPSLSRPSTPLDDREYLKRVCHDIRGDSPTSVESAYFVADADGNKRAKVVEWLIAEKDRAAQKFAQWVDKERVFDRNRGNERFDTSLNLWREASKNDAQKQLIRANLDLEGAMPNPEQVQALVFERWDADIWQYLMLSQSTDLEALAKNHVINAVLDEEFLRRVCQDARGTAPTRLEREYFRADQDPKKREKVLDLMLKDPALAKKLGDGWKQKMLQPEPRIKYLTHVRGLLLKSRIERLEMSVPDRLQHLLDELIKEKRGDEQTLDSLTSAILGRLPTESERKLVIGKVSQSENKRSAWLEVIKTFGGTAEAKRHAKELSREDRKYEKK